LGDPQKTEVLTLDKEKVLPLNPRKESQQYAVTVLKDDNNQNGKETTETRLTRKKARKLSKKKDKLQNILEGASQKKNSQNWSFARISEKQHMALCHGEVI
jgi:hypothetical protein